MLLDGRTAPEPTPARTDYQLARAQGRRAENRAKVNQKEMWLNVVALRSGRLPAGGCRCVLARCSCPLCPSSSLRDQCQRLRMRPALCGLRTILEHGGIYELRGGTSRLDVHGRRHLSV